MKNVEDVLREEKQKVIKNLKIKKNICSSVLVGSIVLTGIKGISTVNFFENYNTEKINIASEIILDILPISGIVISSIKRKQYVKDLNKLD